MATQRKDGTWEARRRTVLLDGTKCRKSFYAQTHDQAEAYADAWDRQLQGEGNGSFGDYATRIYLPTVEHHSFKWRQQIGWALNRHILPRFQNDDLGKIERHDVQVFLNLKGKTLSPRSVGHIRKVLGAVLTLAEIDGKVQRNPMRGIKLASPKEATKVVYSPEECAQLFHAAEGQTVQLPILLGAFLGMRLGECLGLLRADVKEGEVYVRQQAQKQSGHIKVKELKTDSSRRRIPVTPAFYAHYARIASEHSLFACANTLGTVQDPENVSRSLALACKKADLERCSFHHLRSSFASNMDELGCPSRAKKELLGHKAGDVTDGYSRAYDQTKRRFLGMLLGVLDGDSCLPIYAQGVGVVGAE